MCWELSFGEPDVSGNGDVLGVSALTFEHNGDGGCGVGAVREACGGGLRSVE